MIQMRHIGIYVNDLSGMTNFYKTAFRMHVLRENVVQKDTLIGDLLGSSRVCITKLITEYGRQAGIGDMLELLWYRHEDTANDCPFISDSCVMHIAFCVPDMEETIGRIISLGGSVHTNIHVMENGNKCCFCRDLEGNWLELIEADK